MNLVMILQIDAQCSYFMKIVYEYRITFYIARRLMLATRDTCLFFSFSACIPAWTTMNQLQYSHGTLMPGINTVPSCMSACLTNIDCIGITWRFSVPTCYIAFTPGNSLSSSNTDYGAYVLNRCTQYPGTVL